MTAQRLITIAAMATTVILKFSRLLIFDLPSFSYRRQSPVDGDHFRHGGVRVRRLTAQPFCALFTFRAFRSPEMRITARTDPRPARRGRPRSRAGSEDTRRGPRRWAR